MIIMDNTNYVLRTSQAELILNQNGTLESIRHLTHGEILFCQSSTLWEIILQEPSTPDVLGERTYISPYHSSLPKIHSSKDEIHIYHETIGDGTRLYAVAVETILSVQEDSFHIRIKIHNQEQNLIVREVSGIILHGKLQPHVQLLWPYEAGQRLVPDTDIAANRVTYPKEASMQYCVIDAVKHGLYIASHDDSFQTTYFNAYKYTGSGTYEFSVTKIPYLAPSESWESAPFILKPYEGTWHQAAKIYRKWANTWWQPPPQNSLSHQLTGWQLVIMKQQNGQIIWNYHDISKLVSWGKSLGLNAIGLYGWTRGGHDRHYPDYEPDPAMGGADVLKAEIKKAREAGISVILYVNGQLMDTLTPYYQHTWKEHACVSERGDPFLEMWQKYHDAPARVHAFACQSTDAWSDKLLELARQVHALGASGILYDQIGSPRWPLCFSPKHKHNKPAEATGPGVIANLRRIRQEMVRLDPDFIIMTEHVCDCINMHVHWTHGSGAGFTPSKLAFPSLFRYTFPEYIMTQRHKTPVLDRDSAYFGLIHGLKPEVEYRYNPDRLFVEKQCRPSFKDYQNVVENEGIRMMQYVDKKESEKHLRQLTTFANNHAEWLDLASYREREFIETVDSNLHAACFLSGSRLGVMLWNPTDIPISPKLSLKPAADFLEAFSSEEESPSDSTLNPHTYRLYCYQIKE